LELLYAEEAFDPLGQPALDGAPFEREPTVQAAFQFDADVHDQLRSTTTGHIT